MKQNTIAARVAACTALCASSGAVADDLIRPINRRPNVILIMCDDLGWGDVAYPQRLRPDTGTNWLIEGHEVVDTVNIRRMAEEGMKFHRFYAAGSVCTPSRVGFLTGRTPTRMDVFDGFSEPMRNRELTLAEIAKSQGYFTAHFGKWHMGSLTPDLGDGRYSAPWHNGFQNGVLGYEWHVTPYDPYKLASGSVSTPGLSRRFWRGPGDDIEDQGDTPFALEQYTDGFVMDNVLEFLDVVSLASDTPFFATIWCVTGHANWNSDPADTQYDAYDTDELCELDDYYTALDALDGQIGELLDKLEALGIAEDTLVVFTSDNGPANFGNGGSDPLFDCGKPGRTGGYQAGTGQTVPLLLRGKKGDFYEGGIRVPGVFWWPGTIEAGSESHAYAGQVDVLTTMLDIWGVTMPDDRPLEGESLLPMLLGQAAQRTGPVYYNQALAGEGAYYAYVDAFGDWLKLHRDSDTASWELFDLHADPQETADLAGAQPGVVTTMGAAWSALNTQIVTDQLNSPEFGGPDRGEAGFAGDADYIDAIDAMVGLVRDAKSPFDLAPGAYTAPEPRVVLERQYATLLGDITVDADGQTAATYAASGTGPYTPPSGNITVDKGLVVHSYLVHHEDDAAVTSESFELEFDHDIVGLVWTTSRLQDTDFLAFAEPDFENGAPTDIRGTLDDATDSVQVVSPKKIIVTMSAGNGERDQLRVLTSTPLQWQPEPCAADVEGDGDLDPDDQIAFAALFVATDPRADIAEPFGTFNLNDIDRYTQAYLEGCEF